VVTRLFVLVATAAIVPVATGGGHKRFEPVAMAFWDTQSGIVASVGWRSCDVHGRCLVRLAGTTDGGRTWANRRSLRTSGFPTPTLAAVPGTDTIWFAAASLVLRSDDQGRTWRRVWRPFSELSFASASAGWAVSAAGIDATDDGGRTWRRLHAPCSAGLAGEVHVSLASLSRGWLLCEREPGAGQQLKSVYSTADGGKTWRLRSSADLDLPRTGRGLPGSGYGHGITFRPSGVGWLWESRGSFLATRNAGHTWRPLALGEPEIVEAQSAQLLSDRGGFALMRRPHDVALERTNDGGHTWRVVRTWPR
jgi:photosystem II stability/assembly factor-like uncharacterized protein